MSSLPTIPPSGPRAKIYLSARAVAQRYPVTAYYAGAHIRPDAWCASGSSDKAWPMWLPATVENFLASRAAKKAT